MIIAAALAQITDRRTRRSTALLLDEPTAALDLEYQLGVASAAAVAPSAKEDSTIAVSTHDLTFAAGSLRARW